MVQIDFAKNQYFFGGYLLIVLKGQPGKEAYYCSNWSKLWAWCGLLDDMDHLFVKSNFYGRLWSLIYDCIGFSTTTHSSLMEHLLQFGSPTSNIFRTIGSHLIYKW